MNLSEGLLAQARSRSNKTGILSRYHGRDYTLAEYKNMITSVVRTCQKAEIMQDTVAILLFDDCPKSIGVFLGCIEYGIVPLLVSKKVGKVLLGNIVELADPSVIWSDQEFCDEMHDRTFVRVSEENGRLTFETQKREKQIYGNISAKEVAYLGMTSGSSGMPKLVMHSHKEMLFANENYALHSLQLTQKDRLYSVSKMNFTYGMANSLFFSFASGATALLDEESFTAKHCQDCLREFKPTCFFAVPTVYQALCRALKEGWMTKEDWKSLRLCVSAGELLPSDLARDWKELTGHEIVDSVGCSETGSAFLVNFGGEEKRGSAGTAVLGYHVHLLQENPEDKGVEGVLCVKSESNALGYYRSPMETREKFLNGWLKTGDIFRVDEDGYYWFVGREDTMFKHNGMWICPEQVEQVLLQYTGVNECAVFEVKRNEKSQMAAVICVDENFKSVIELKRYVKTQLESYKCPKIIRIVDNLPLNINGKRDYARMKEIALRCICTIDGEARLGKGVLAHRMANDFDLHELNAGRYYRILAWGYRCGLLSEEDLDCEKVLLDILNKEALFEKPEMYREEHALITAQVSQHNAVQWAVLRHMRSIAQEYSIVAEGRNMGTEVFDDADLKIFLTGSVEESVRKWCFENGYGEEMVRIGIENVIKRNCMDRERGAMPLRKAEDAVEICVDGKAAETVFLEVADLWKEI